MTSAPLFNTVDIVIVALLLVGILRGTTRGLSGELASIISIAAAVFAGWYLYRPLGEYLSSTMEWSDLQADTLAFIIIIVAALILMMLVRRMLKAIMKFSFEGALERGGGALFGFVRYAVLMAALLVAIAVFGEGRLREQVVDESLIGRHAIAHLMPLYEELADRYPGLRKDEEDEEDVEVDWPWRP